MSEAIRLALILPSHCRTLITIKIHEGTAVVINLCTLQVHILILQVLNNLNWCVADQNPASGKGLDDI